MCKYMHIYCRYTQADLHSTCEFLVGVPGQTGNVPELYMWGCGRGPTAQIPQWAGSNSHYHHLEKHHLGQ